jgi:hypothetical protein
MQFKSFMEALKGDQHKLDKNKNGKVDAHDFKLLRKEEEELSEAKPDIYHKHMLKALGKSRLPKDHSYTSSIANNGDFVVYDGSMRIVGRIPKGEHSLKESAFVAKAAYAKKDDKKHFTLGKKKFPVTIKKDVADEIAESMNSKQKTAIDQYMKTIAGKNIPQDLVKVSVDALMKALKEDLDLTENFKTGSVKLNDGSSVLLKKQDADLLNQMFEDLNPANRKKMMGVAMKDKNGFEEILSFAREAL